LEKLGFEYKDLNGKTLILDGLDEVNINDRRDVLESLYGDWIFGHHDEKFSTCAVGFISYVIKLVNPHSQLTIHLQRTTSPVERFYAPINMLEL